MLLGSFISALRNTRTDKYGGSIQGRVTILREIITGARARVGDFPILIKMNCDDHIEGGTDRVTFPEIAREVNLNAESVRKALHRVRAFLQKCINRFLGENGTANGIVDTEIC